MKKDTSKSTILVISMGFLALYLLFAWRWAGITSLVIGLTGILSDTLSNKIEWVWMKLSHILSLIVPSVLLTILFYLILFPISLLSKLFTKDPLMLSNKNSSFFIDVNKEFNKKSFETIW
jgi:hypothetical protein